MYTASLLALPLLAVPALSLPLNARTNITNISNVTCAEFGPDAQWIPVNLTEVGHVGFSDGVKNLCHQLSEGSQSGPSVDSGHQRRDMNNKTVSVDKVFHVETNGEMSASIGRLIWLSDQAPGSLSCRFPTSFPLRTPC